MTALPGIVTDLERLAVASDPIEPGAKAKHLGRTLTRVGRARRALGVAAPQIGVLRRVFYYDARLYPNDGEHVTGVVCNPVMTDMADKGAVTWEGCLSLPKHRIQVMRPVWAEFDWMTVDGHERHSRLEGMTNIVWCHETDHCYGITTLDRMVPGTQPARR